MSKKIVGKYCEEEIVSQNDETQNITKRLEEENFDWDELIEDINNNRNSSHNPYKP